MRIVKLIVLASLLLFIGAIVWALTLPNQWQLEREATIQASPQTVLEHINNGNNWSTWSSRNSQTYPGLYYTFNDASADLCELKSNIESEQTLVDCNENSVQMQAYQNEILALKARLAQYENDNSANKDSTAKTTRVTNTSVIPSLTTQFTFSHAYEPGTFKMQQCQLNAANTVLSYQEERQAGRLKFNGTIELRADASNPNVTKMRWIIEANNVEGIIDRLNGVFRQATIGKEINQSMDCLNYRLVNKDLLPQDRKPAPDYCIAYPSVDEAAKKACINKYTKQCEANLPIINQ